MAIMIASSAVGRGFDPRSGQTKEFKIGISCFSAKHAAFMNEMCFVLINQHRVHTN